MPRLQTTTHSVSPHHPDIPGMKRKALRQRAGFIRLAILPNENATGIFMVGLGEWARTGAEVISLGELHGVVYVGWEGDHR